MLRWCYQCLRAHVKKSVYWKINIEIHVCRHSDWLSGMWQPKRRFLRREWVVKSVIISVQSILIISRPIFSLFSTRQLKKSSKTLADFKLKPHRGEKERLKLPLVISFDSDFSCLSLSLFSIRMAFVNFSTRFSALSLQIRSDISIVGSSEAWYARFFIYISFRLFFSSLSFFHALLTNFNQVWRDWLHSKIGELHTNWSHIIGMIGLKRACWNCRSLFSLAEGW